MSIARKFASINQLTCVVMLTLLGQVAIDRVAIEAHASGPPNIVLILADDLGYGDVTCYNDQAKVATPNIDRLAREGVRLTDAHSPCTVCTPTRYGLLTGQMPFRVKKRGNSLYRYWGPVIDRA